MYTTEDILRIVEGISRDTLLKWIDSGYIDFAYIPETEKESHTEEFTEETYRKIWLMWKFCDKQKLSPQEAHEKADRFLPRTLSFGMHALKTFAQGIPIGSGGKLYISPGECFQVIVTLEIYKIENCNVVVSFDSQCLHLEDGKQTEVLNFKDFYAKMDLVWVFVARGVARATGIQITAKGGGAVKQADISVIIGNDGDSHARNS